MITINEALAKCHILQKASPESISAFSACGGLRRLRKGEHLFLDKEQVKCLYFVIEGRVTLYKQNSIGEKKVVFVYGSGEMLNEVMLQDLPASISCEALTEALVLAFPVKTFEFIMQEDYPLTKAVIESMAKKIRRLYRQLKNTTGSIRGDKRIAAKLWKLSQDYGIPDEAGTRIKLELSITYLADMLGAKRETVSRQMKMLTEAGLVIQESNSFIIPDRDRLQQYFKTP